MWTIEKLKKRFSMSDQQIYRRINAAQRPLRKHINRGEKNAIALTEGGFLILENVIELEKQGKTLANAVREVEKSISDGDQVQVDFEVSQEPGGPLESAPGKLQQTQVGSGKLHEEIGYLRGKLDSKDELIAELKDELDRIRQENDDLKRSVALVEFRANERRGWWPWRR